MQWRLMGICIGEARAKYSPSPLQPVIKEMRKICVFI
jgi:hypothetical protein